MNIAQVAGRIREQIHGFSGILSQALGKVEKRFVNEMIYGIQTRQSVKLSEIARSLNENVAPEESHRAAFAQSGPQGSGRRDQRRGNR